MSEEKRFYLDGFIFNLKRRPLALICLIIVTGIFIYVYVFYKLPETVLYEEGEYITLTGYVTDKQIKDDKLLIYMKKTSCESGSISVICYFSYDENDGNQPETGSYISVSGKAGAFKEASNPGEFDLRKYYKSLGYDMPVYKCELNGKSAEYSRYREYLFNLKQNLIKVSLVCFGETDGTIINAMLFGDKASLDADVKDLYQSSGIAHILAISGLHISIIGMAIFTILRKLRIPLLICIPVSVFIIISYAYMIGPGVSVFRAVFMFIMMLLAKPLHRTYDSLTSLSIAALILTVSNPLVLCNAGFYMSFMAVIGIRIFSSVLSSDYEFMHPLIGKLINSFLSCLSVSLFTFPLIAFYYYEFPPYSVLINILIIPLMSVLLILAIITIVSAFIFYPFAKIPGYVCHVILMIYENVCNISLNLPFSRIITGHPHFIKLCIYYLACITLICISLYLAYHREDDILEKYSFHRFLLKFSFWKRLGIILTLLVLFIPVHFGTDITMIDVGQGDGLCIRYGNAAFMIDGGSSSNDMMTDYVLEPYLKYNGISEISYWMVSHPDADHYSGLLDILNDYKKYNFKIRNIALPGSATIKEDAKDIIDTASSLGINILYLSRGDTLKFKDLTFDVINPPVGYLCEDKNEYSMVLYMQYGNIRGLLTGDATMESEKLYTEYALNNNINLSNLIFLKVAHHGSDTSSMESTINLHNPRIALISCAAHNSYGHPKQVVMDKLRNTGAGILLTPELGAITLKLYHDNVTVNSYRQ